MGKRGHLTKVLKDARTIRRSDCGEMGLYLEQYHCESD